MTPLLAFALLAVQDPRDTYGRTNAQILAMGHDAWTRFYEKRAGGSTLAMAMGERTYAEALAARNDGLLKARGDRKTLLALRKALEGFYIDAVEVGTLGTGGGTMWTPISNVYWTDLETTLHRILRPAKPAPHRVVSDVTKELALLRGRVAKSDLMPEDRPKVAPAFAKLEGDWRAVSALASTRNRRESDLVLEYCRAVLRDVRLTATPK